MIRQLCLVTVGKTLGDQMVRTLGDQMVRTLGNHFEDSLVS